MDIANLIAATSAVTAAALGAWNRYKLNQTNDKVETIHVLVNSNLEAVVTKLSAMTAERDKLKEVLSEPEPTEEPSP